MSEVSLHNENYKTLRIYYPYFCYLHLSNIFRFLITHYQALHYIKIDSYFERITATAAGLQDNWAPWTKYKDAAVF
jgi:hypothetical protein